MTKRQFCVEIADRAGVDLDTAMALYEAHEDLVMEIIATEDEIKFTWGRIFGFFKEPQKIHGMFAELPSVKARDGWSLAKSGMPGIEWSKEAKQYTPIDPTELYCEWNEAKFTSRARSYRKDRNLPEIPEYDGLPEKMIVSLMEKADEKRYGKKTSRLIKEEAKSRIERVKTSAARNHIIRLEWINDRVKEGMKLEDAQKVPMQLILEEKRKQWQDAIQRYEDAKKLKNFNSESKGDIVELGRLNPYEIYKEDSMASYYLKLIEDNAELEDEDLLEIMKKDAKDFTDYDLPDEESNDFEEDPDIMYDDEGYRIDKNGKRMEYWESLEYQYRKGSYFKRSRERKMEKDKKRFSDKNN